MPTIYLRPEDISDAQATVILDYLNSSSNAEAIAARIELENELDIGEGLATRLILERERLGGRFENLQQVYDVPYIGPERFTEIAVSLLDLQLPNTSLPTTPSYNVLLDELARLRREVTQLRTGIDSGTVIGLTTGKCVQLQVLQTDVFLGQHLTVEIYAYNTENQSPLVDQPVTLSTNWGVLQYQQGYAWQQDAVVEVRTDIHGRARVRLRSPSYETLTQEQQLALEVALQVLDASAETPAAIREQLEALVLNYRLENNLELRKAIDIYFNSQKVAILESINRRFFSDSWRFHYALIYAYIHQQDGGQEPGHVQGLGNGVVECFSTVKVRLKDWVGAWYQTYLDYLENGNQFSQRVQTLSANSGNGSLLISGVLSEIGRWTLAELGVAGSIIGEKSTESAVRKFLADDIQTLPDQQQLQLYSALSVAVKPTAVTQLGTLQAVANTQLTLVDEINNRVGSVEDISDLAAAMQQGLDTMNSQFNDFQSSLNQFNTDYSSFNSSFTDFNNDLTGFNSDYSSFNSNLVTFNSDYSGFNANYGTFNAQILEFDTNYTLFNSEITSFNDKYNTFDLRLNQLDSQLSSANANFEAMQTDISKFNISYAEYNSSLGTLRADIGDLKVSVKDINSRVLNPNR